MTTREAVDAELYFKKKKMTDKGEYRILRESSARVLWECVSHPENFGRWWSGLPLAPKHTDEEVEILENIIETLKARIKELEARNATATIKKREPEPVDWEAKQ
jgi:hypothetical protein